MNCFPEIKHTTTLFSLSDHDTLSREWRVIVDEVQINYHGNPADTRRWVNVGLTFVQRRRRCTNGKPALIHRLVSAGKPIFSILVRRDRAVHSRDSTSL